MKIVLQSIVKVLNMLGLFKMTYDVGHIIGQSSDDDDVALSTEDNSLSNSQISKIGAYVIASGALGVVAALVYKRFF